ncbi:transporter substrate-binding domain-containing protein [Burkholderia multivorans]|uniref:transporter substrate-binding domain-containing protein n=1 Tax=Burkholderia multivorans TaxID=87883 RepID=UPI00075DF809|nr:transporter substrate-binding domain-containing protein [Burkholderia multivorans]KVT37162.1 amino acid ABC transporter substrate-binding protein [Burkholderia multivorans]MBU9124987.1 transporter substrate-binding domain-containing protein [Burkholderia multivorans]MBU9309105.1 transporter substrate-binding domain-containing protein [Burkholderia multivorans]MBU9398746.1 transporter substrate-binding domain-containing protein [Burkholderia multivorans]MBU9571116.1 transporter substrate-bin
MKVRIAYIEEPPFGWTGRDHVAIGADIELADVVLRAIGVSRIEHHLTTFEELLPGVQERRWDMNVPLFVTAERAQHVAFSVPVWSIGDGFLLRRGNPKALTSYEAVAARSDARLGIIAGQVQFDSAKSAGVLDSQIVLFKDQPAAISALRAGQIDAYASTAVGNRVLAESVDGVALEAFAHDRSRNGRVPVGAFSFNKSNHGLVQAVNKRLGEYLGSSDHRARMARYGFTHTEIDGVIISQSAKHQGC